MEATTKKIKRIWRPALHQPLVENNDDPSTENKSIKNARKNSPLGFVVAWQMQNDK